MKTAKHWLCIFLFITLCISSTSQEKNNYSSEIEKQVILQVNLLRDSLNLPPLRLDNVLANAAKDHAFFISKKQNLTHFQETFTKETPAERIKHYGGNRTYSGENAAKVKVIKDSLGLIDRKAIANQLFKNWYSSPPHYKNMIHPSFTCVNLEYSPSKKDGMIYAVQVFSSDEIILPPHFNNENRAWGVRPSEKTCKDDLLTYETMFFANSVVVNGNDIYIHFHDMNFFYGVFNSQNDGIAVDIILREQLPCDRENQFHISEIHDGEMQQPVYLMDMLRNNESRNEKKVYVKVGELPDYLQGRQWQPNIIVINDNKLCDYSYPVEVPSAIFPLLPLDPYWEEPDSTQIITHNYSFVMNDTLQAELWYGNREKTFLSIGNEEFSVISDLQPFIQKVKVNCYASVNGPTKYNLELLDYREETVREIMKYLEFTEDQVNYHSSENWEMMNLQIEKYDLSALQSKNETQIKSYLKKNKSHQLDSLLFDQRKTKVTAYVDTIITVNTYSRYLLGENYGLQIPIDSVNWNEILKEEYIEKKKLIPESLIDSLKGNESLKTNLLGAASIKNVNSYLDSVLVEEFVEKVDPFNSKQVFNYAHFLTKYWFTKYTTGYMLETAARSMNPEELRNLIAITDLSIIDSTDYMRLEVNVLLAGIHYYVAHNDWTHVNTYFDRISELVRLEGFTAQEATELALFCNHFHKFKIAVDILRPFHNEVLLPEDGYFVLAKTSSLIRRTLEDEEYWVFMNSAKRANQKRYCNWLDTSFQIQRDEFIKRDFCKTCAKSR